MKKIVTRYREPSSIVFDPNPFTTDDKNWDVVSYDAHFKVLWHISPPRKSMSVFDGINWKKCSTKEDFLSSILDLYPDDIEFFLFYPEALDGKLPDEYYNP